MTWVFRALAHVQIMLAMTLLTLKVLDWFNPYMNFLGLPVSAVLLVAFCLLTLAQAGRLLYCERRLLELSPRFAHARPLVFSEPARQRPGRPNRRPPGRR